MSNDYLDFLAYFGIGGAHPGGFSLTQSIFENENIRPNHQVLDIGCGTGRTSAFLAKHFGCQVTAVDLHPVMIEKAKKRFEIDKLNINLLHGDVQNMNLPVSTFDFIISESVISFNKIPKMLHELSRILKKDGTLIMIEMAAEQSLPKLLEKEAETLYGVDEILNEKEWIEQLQKQGFSKVEKINTPSLLLPSDIEDIDQSENISMTLYDLWERHNQFIEQYSNLVGYRVFKCHLM